MWNSDVYHLQIWYTKRRHHALVCLIYFSLRDCLCQGCKWVSINHHVQTSSTAPTISFINWAVRGGHQSSLTTVCRWGVGLNILFHSPEKGSNVLMLVVKRLGRIYFDKTMWISIFFFFFFLFREKEVWNFKEIFKVSFPEPYSHG